MRRSELIEADRGGSESRRSEPIEADRGGSESPKDTESLKDKRPIVFFRGDWFDLAVLVVFAGLSVWLLAFLLSQTGPNRLWTGTDGPYIGDQMQYLGWIQDAGHHLLIANPFNTAPSQGVFLNPFLLISGLLTRLGLSAAMSYLLWQPVAMLMFFLAVRAYVYRLVRRTAARRCALVLALLFISPVEPYAGHLTSLFSHLDIFYIPPVTNEVWPIIYLWGYPLTAIAIAAMCLCLLYYERDRSLDRVGAVAPALGLLCGWLQPWQGATLLGVLVLAEMLMWKFEGTFRWRLLGTSAVFTVAPLIYYWALGRFDTVWKAAGILDQSPLPFVSVAIVIAPLAIPALLAYRLRTRDFQDVVVRFWPFVALLEFEAIGWTKMGTFELHALQGLSIPLAILAVVGVASLKLGAAPPLLRSALALLLVVLLLAPTGIRALNQARSVGASFAYGSDPYFLTRSEQDAIDYLKANPQPGAVLAPVYIGQVVPGLTGRSTWVGLYTWTPQYPTRALLAAALFSGKLSTTQATRLIRSSGARFLLSDCSNNADLSKLGAVLETGGTRRFGCASVYRVAS